MNTTVKRRPLNQVVRKAPQQLWDNHRRNYEINATSSSSARKLSDKTAADFSKSDQAKSFSTSRYSIFPVQNSGTVLPLFHTPLDSTNSFSSTSNVFAFDYQASGFIWSLYKPAYALTISSGHNNRISKNNKINNTEDDAPPSVTSYVERAFTKAEQEFREALKSTSFDKNKCPFQTAALVEMNKIRQAMEWHPQKNNRFVNFGGERGGASSASSASDDFDFNNNNDEFMRNKMKELSRAEVLAGLGMNQEKEVLRRKNLMKAAAAAELPYSMALAWASLKNWTYECGTILARDISGVVPVFVKPDDDDQEQLSLAQQAVFSSSSSSSSSSSFIPPPLFAQNMIQTATFEAVIEGHTPRSLPSTRLEQLLSKLPSKGGIFTRMMSNPNKDEFSATSYSMNNYNRSNNVVGSDQERDALKDVEVSQVSVVRHGYYLQEPVTVVRWRLSGRNCAQVSPDEVLRKLFYQNTNIKNNNNTKNKNNRVDGTSTTAMTTTTTLVVGHPRSSMTKRYDIPIPMCCLRGVEINDPTASSNSRSMMMNSGGSNSNHNEDAGDDEDEKKSNHKHSSEGGRKFALPRSPYASEEMIASSPNSSRFADAVRRANLMDGYYTP